MAKIELEIPEPNEKQKMFLRDHHKVVGFGGARGGGKSWAVQTKAILLCLTYAGIKVMILRRTYPELTANHIKPICSRLPRGSYKYNDTKKELTFPNGSQILFRYCACDRDLNNFQGTETDVIFIDEATHFSEFQYTALMACVRGVNAFPKRAYLTCNPGGIGHNFVKRLFVDRQYRDGENPEDYSFIQAFATDNKALMQSQPDYIKQLEMLPPKLRAAWLEGRWDLFEGQFFEEFTDDPKHYDDRLWTHVIEPFEIPDGWRIYRSFDWGYGKPFSVGWWACDREGILYRILELYGCTQTANEGVKWTPDEVFSRVAEIEREHRWLRGKQIFGVADPAIWDAQTGISIAETAEKYRVYFERGDHARIPGWMQVHYRLRFNSDGVPGMYIFKNCKAFIRTFPLLQFDSHRVEDIDTDGEDHVADETRYMCMARPITPQVEEKKKLDLNDPLNQRTERQGRIFRKV